MNTLFFLKIKLCKIFDFRKQYIFTDIVENVDNSIKQVSYGEKIFKFLTIHYFCQTFIS